MDGKTVTVEVLEEHSYDGVTRPLGSRYEAEEAHVEFLGLRGYARPVAAAAPPEEPAPKRRK